MSQTNDEIGAEEETSATRSEIDEENTIESATKSEIAEENTINDDIRVLDQVLETTGFMPVIDLVKDSKKPTILEALRLIRSSSSCSCKVTDCVKACDMECWLPTAAKLRSKEVEDIACLYLELGEVDMNKNLLHDALDKIRLACLCIEAMPQLDDLLFWPKAWMLVGRVHIKKAGGWKASSSSEGGGDVLGKSGKGIHKYLCKSDTQDAVLNLSAALSCFEEARNALPSGSEDLQYVIKGISCVHNELGLHLLQKNEFTKAESALSDAIDAAKQGSDSIGLISTNYNMGHGRYTMAEELVAAIQGSKLDANLRKQAVDIAKKHFSESIRYCGAAKMEVDARTGKGLSVSDKTKSDVYAMFAEAYLKLGMLLTRENITAEVPCDIQTRKEVSANDALTEAIAVHESRGDVGKQDVAYACFQLGCYQRNCCFRSLQANSKNNNTSKGKNGDLQMVNHYASLADGSWGKALDFCDVNIFPNVFLSILKERAALLFTLSRRFQSNEMMESALSYLLEGRHVPEAVAVSFAEEYSDLPANILKRLQMVIKEMYSDARSKKSANEAKLKKLHEMSSQLTRWSKLDDLYSCWSGCEKVIAEETDDSVIQDGGVD